ncbi:OLC1v1013459C1 [Oldenlandia corymbosa var. corymbosa]|uniref:OLC1v1013459C1 n=1 Tax=Oldenlandia corymbosa var. corymbosa TaxID=529605 RepID=A0AAV1DYM1_OLDCO|nr:OLC1v1013459C1 [Oldenlandia corymbosa var. corymbosa]
MGIMLIKQLEVYICLDAEVALVLLPSPSGQIGDLPVMFAKPQTFMNASGESVGAIVSYYKIPLKQVLVIFDDMDLPFAKLRMLPKGGLGGHNGYSLVMCVKMQSNDKLTGIGRPPGKMNPASYVLRRFDKQESGELDFSFQTGLEAVRLLLLEGLNKSATFVNTSKSLEQLQWQDYEANLQV